jgi:hypothetical protein
MDSHVQMLSRQKALTMRTHPGHLFSCSLSLAVKTKMRSVLGIGVEARYLHS